MDLFSIPMREDRQNTQGWSMYSLCFFSVSFFVFFSFLIHVYGANCFQCHFSCDTQLIYILSFGKFGIIFHECLGVRHKRAHTVNRSVKIKWPCSMLTFVTSLIKHEDAWYYALRPSLWLFSSLLSLVIWLWFHYVVFHVVECALK